MTIAEIHGKISGSGRDLREKMEDLLTSDVFGACKYLRPETLLIPLIKTAISIDGVLLADYLVDTVNDAKYRFWPRLNSSEPDLFISIRDEHDNLHIVINEAKHLSGKSSDTLEAEEIEIATAPSDQLAREYDDLVNIERNINLSTKHIQRRFLVYITAHRSIPEDSLVDSTDEIQHFYPDLDAGPVFWTSACLKLVSSSQVLLPKPQNEVLRFYGARSALP